MMMVAVKVVAIMTSILGRSAPSGHGFGSWRAVPPRCFANCKCSSILLLITSPPLREIDRDAHFMAAPAHDDEQVLIPVKLLSQHRLELQTAVKVLTVLAIPGLWFQYRLQPAVQRSQFEEVRVRPQLVFAFGNREDAL